MVSVGPGVQIHYSPDAQSSPEAVRVHPHSSDHVETVFVSRDGEL